MLPLYSKGKLNDTKCKPWGPEYDERWSTKSCSTCKFWVWVSLIFFIVLLYSVPLMCFHAYSDSFFKSEPTVRLQWTRAEGNDSFLVIAKNQLWDMYSHTSHRRTRAERWETHVPWRRSWIHCPSQQRAKGVWRILRHPLQKRDCENRIHCNSKHFLFHFCKVFILL